jgi:hypothetical protein
MVLTSWVQLLCARGVRLETESLDCLAWAVQMLESGKDSESLCILASLTPPFNYWEVQRYLEAAIQEIGLERLSETPALSAFVADALRCMLSGDTTVAETLSKLRDLCVAYDHPNSLYPFYMLHFALEDLSTGRQTYSYYWPDADDKNIHQIIETAAMQYVAGNKNRAEPSAAGDAR